MNAAGLRSAAKVLATNATGHALQQGLEEVLAEVERLRAALVAYVELTERVWDANPDTDPGRWFSLPEYEAAIEVLGLPSKR